MLLDTIEERALLDRKFRHSLPVEYSPQTIAEDGAQKPSAEHGDCDGDSGADDRVHWDELDDVLGLIGVGGEEVGRAGGGSDEADEGGGEGIVAARGAEAEEAVPVEGGGFWWWVGCG